jgi:hypothetical protein
MEIIYFIFTDNSDISEVKIFSKSKIKTNEVIVF